MKTLFQAIWPIVLCLALMMSWAQAAKNNNGPGNQPAPTQTAPVYVDPVNGYLQLYDTNHDGRLEADELKKMAVLDPAAYQQAMVFADSRGQLGIDELNAWRTYLKAKWSQQQNKAGNGGSGS